MQIHAYADDSPESYLNFDGPSARIGEASTILPGQTPAHIARLANWLYDTQGEGSSDTPIGRAAAWFAAHVRGPRPVTRRTVQWQTRGEIELLMANFGPTCSAGDLAAAIAALPNHAALGVAPWQPWDRV